MTGFIRHKKFIYLAGPITGCTEVEANDWRKYVTSKLNENIIGISPLRCEPIEGDVYDYTTNDKFGTANAINGKNYYDTLQSDLVFAYLPRALNDKRPSYGTVIEIGWAIGMRKPIILVTDDAYFYDHPLIRANVNWIFNTLDDAIEVIHGLFDQYLGNE